MRAKVTASLEAIQLSDKSEKPVKISHLYVVTFISLAIEVWNKILYDFWVRLACLSYDLKNAYMVISFVCLLTYDYIAVIDSTQDNYFLNNREECLYFWVAAMSSA